MRTGRRSSPDVLPRVETPIVMVFILSLMSRKTPPAYTRGAGVTSGVLCEQLINERLQLGFGGHDWRGLHQLGRLAEQSPCCAMPAGEPEQAACCQRPHDH